MAEPKPCPCDLCEIRIGLAIAIDAYFYGDDCPYKCQRYKEWQEQTGGEKHD